MNPEDEMVFAAATARDRDKLHQHILVGLGWKLHRIWSTDWWHDADKEMAALLRRLQELRAEKNVAGN